MTDITAAVAHVEAFVDGYEALFTNVPVKLSPETLNALRTLLDSHARLSRTAVQWRRIEEGSPRTTRQRVLVCLSAGSVIEAMWVGNAFIDHGGRYVYDITRWAPLPGGPEES